MYVVPRINKQLRLSGLFLTVKLRVSIIFPLFIAKVLLVPAILIISSLFSKLFNLNINLQWKMITFY